MISTGGHLTILESVDSTNNYAMAQVRTGLAKHGDGFFAMAQTKGKGQRGKAWMTEPGTNIILSLVLQPSSLQISQQFQFSMAIALAAFDFLGRYAGDETTIKWPNDIYWRDRKAGGILIENVVEAQSSAFGVHSSGYADEELRTINYELKTAGWLWAITGIGININQTAFPENIVNAVSLKQITGKHWDVIELVKELCGCIQLRFLQLQADKNLLKEYNDRLFKKGQTVKFKKNNRVFEGVVKEVNAHGELVVITSIEERFAFGEVEWALSF